MASDVLVLGTIHQFHLMNEGYTYTHLERLLEAYEPDLVCLEIRPEDYETGEYKAPEEMVAVGLKWAMERGIPAAPVDWWEDDMPQRHQEAMAELTATPEGQVKLDRLMADAAVGPTYEARFQELTQTYQRANSPETQDYFRRIHDLETEVLGEGNLNKRWEQRNKNMAQLVLEAIGNHEAKRAIVLTGCEHKYIIEDHLGDAGLTLLQLEDFLSEDIELTAEELSAFRDKSARIFVFQRVDGPQANTRPDSVDLSGVLERIKTLLEHNPGDTEVIYYRGLYHYLQRQYDEALADFKVAVQDRVALLLGWAPLWEIAALRAGQMLDLLGQREAALDHYRTIRQDGKSFVNHAEQLIAELFTRPT